MTSEVIDIHLLEVVRRLDCSEWSFEVLRLSLVTYLPSNKETSLPIRIWLYRDKNANKNPKHEYLHQPKKLDLACKGEQKERKKEILPQKRT